MLGGLQFFASLALRDRAQTGAWVTFVPPGVAARLAALGDGLPLPPLLRLVYARAAFAAGDPARTALELQRAGPSPDAFALRAALARAKGDVDEAVRDDLAAGDYARLASDLDALAARGDVAGALEVQRAAVAQLATRRMEPDAFAEAQYRLGIFEQARGQAFAPGSATRRAHEVAAASAYARSVALAPLDERYLLAAANQALNMGAWAQAAATFARAAAVDPVGADPPAGLGDLAYRRGDFALARRYLARARTLDPHSLAVARLAAKFAR